MYLKQIVCNIINVFTATFDQFNASLLNKSIIIITIWNLTIITMKYFFFFLLFLHINFFFFLWYDLFL